MRFAQHPLFVAITSSFVWVAVLLVLGYLVSVIPDPVFTTLDMATYFRLFAFTMIAVVPLLFFEYDVSSVLKPHDAHPLVSPEEARRHLRFGFWICLALLLFLAGWVHIVSVGHAAKLWGGPTQNSPATVFLLLMLICWLARTVTWYLEPLTRAREQRLPRVYVQGAPVVIELPNAGNP